MNYTTKYFSYDMIQIQAYCYDIGCADNGILL